MKAKRKRPFDFHPFLATADSGRTISTYQKNQAVFFQREAADFVLCIQEGKMKVTVVPDQGKEAVIAIMGKAISAREIAAACHNENQSSDAHRDG